MKTWHLIIILAALAFGLWYFYGVRAPSVDTQPQSGSLSAGNTTADISSDLDQTPDISAGLDADAAASTQDIEGL